MKQQSSDALGHSLRKFARDIHSVIETSRGLPSPQSAAYGEWADLTYGDEAWGVDPVNSADTAAVMMLASAVDHAHALADVLVRHQTAAFALQRGCLEAAARARYLADPSIELAERIRRYVNDVLYGYSEQRIALEEYDQPDAAKDAEAEIAKILHAAERYPEWGTGVANRGKAPARIGASYRSAGHLINELLHAADGRAFGKTVHRVASAVTHGSHHGFRISGAVDVGPDGSRDYPPRDKMSDQQRAVLHYPAVIGLYNGALAVYFRLGWPHADLKVAARRVLVTWTEIASPGSSKDLAL